MISRALSLVSPDSHAAGRLLFRYGHVLGLEAGDYTGAQKAVEAALDIAERGGDLGLEMRILADAARVDRYNLQLDEWLKKSQRASELAAGSEDLMVQVRAEGDIALALYCKGDMEGAQQHAAAMLIGSERLRGGNAQAMSFHYNMILHHSIGDWQKVRNFGEQGLAVSPGFPGLLDYFTALEHEIGNIDQGDQYLGELLKVMETTASRGSTAQSLQSVIIPYIARINGDVGLIPTAQRAAEAVLSDSTAAPVITVMGQISLALIAVNQQDAETAADMYEFLESGHRGMPVQGIMCFERLLGPLAHTMGNLDQAVSHFEDSLTFCRAGYRVELAWTCRDYADTLLRRNGEGDRAKAMSLLDESLAISSELGMRPLMERTIARQEGISTTLKDVPAYPDGLTEREVGVMRLIASGRTNQEIGDELFISARTVANHVASIFNKTGAANRAEAATYASRNGLV